MAIQVSPSLGKRVKQKIPYFVANWVSGSNQTTMMVSSHGSFCDIYSKQPTSSAPQRRSTIEVHPIFSEALHFRSSIPHLKTDFSKNQIASRPIIPWPESRKHLFRNQDWHSDDLGSRNPVLQKQKSGDVLPLLS